MITALLFSRRRVACAIAALLAAAALPAAAQTTAWPNKPVRLVVGFAPGGGTDIMARAVAQSLTELLGQSFVVDNKPGASGNLSVADVAKAAPDGYTLLVAPTSVETANPYLFKSTVSPARDLTPVMGIGQMQMYVVAKPTMEASNVKALASQALKERFNSLGAMPAPVPTAEFRKLLADEGKTLSGLIKERNIVVE